MNTIAGVVARNARTRPDGVAFVEAVSDETMTWAEYDERSSQMAGSLRAFEPGERVALQLPDGPGGHVAMLACEKAGIVARGRASGRWLTSWSAAARARCCANRRR